MPGDRVSFAMPGLASGWVNFDKLVGILGSADVVSRFFLSRTDYAATGSVVAAVRNATGGGGTGIQVTLGNNVEGGAATGAISVAAGGSLYLRVTAADAASMNLTGWFELGAQAVTGPTLTTLARVKEAEGLAVTTWDALLTNLIAGVSDRMQRWMGRTIAQASYSRKLDPPSLSAELLLPEWPIVSVTSLTEDGGALALTTDYEIESARGGLVRVSAGVPTQWASEWRGIVVAWDGGYATVPESLVLAATDQVRHAYHQVQPGGGRLGQGAKALETGGSSPYDALSGAFLASTIEAMRPFRRLAI